MEELKSVKGGNPLPARITAPDPRASLPIGQKILTNPVVSKAIDMLSGGVSLPEAERYSRQQVKNIKNLPSVIPALSPFTPLPQQERALESFTTPMETISRVPTALQKMVFPSPGESRAESAIKGMIRPDLVPAGYLGGEISRRMPTPVVPPGKDISMLSPRILIPGIAGTIGELTSYEFGLGTIFSRLAKGYKSAKLRGAEKDLESMLDEATTKAVKLGEQKGIYPGEWNAKDKAGRTRAFLKEKLTSNPEFGDILMKKQTPSKILFGGLKSERASAELPGKISKSKEIIPEIAAGGKAIVPPVPAPPVSPLIEEARKYKTAEEFVKRIKSKKGLPLEEMNKEDFQNWVGKENVISGKIKVYRGIRGEDTRGLQPGDMVTLNKEYAKKYGENVMEFDLPVEGLAYFSGVKGGNPELLHQTLSGAQPTEFVWQGTKPHLTSLWQQAQGEMAAAPPKTTVAGPLKLFADNAKSLGLSKQGFLKNYNKGLKNQNLTKRDTAKNINDLIKQTGNTPETFYDNFIKAEEAGSKTAVLEKNLPKPEVIQERPLPAQRLDKQEKDVRQKGDLTKSYPQDTIKEQINQVKEKINISDKKIPPTPKTEMASYEGKFDLPEETGFEAFRRTVEDFNIRLKVLNKGIENVAGENIKENHDLWMQKDMLPRQQADVIRRVRDEKIDFTKKIVGDNLTVSEADQYLHAKHAKERNAKMNQLRAEKGIEPVDGLSGMTDAQADMILKNANPSVKKYSDVVKKMSSDLLEYQTEQGLISSEAAKIIKGAYSDYVPLFRDVSDESLGIGMGLDIRGKEIKRAKGSELRVLSPLGNLFYQKERAHVRVLKNRIGKSIVEMTQNYPFLKDIFVVEKQKFLPRFNEDGELIFLDPKMKFGDNVMGTKIGGDQYFITIKDEKIARSLKNLNLARVNSFVRHARTLLRIWSGMKTRWNPEFLVTNFERDLGEAIVNLGVEKSMLRESGKNLRKDIVKNLFSSQAEIWRYLRGDKSNKTVDEFFSLGGDTGHFWIESAKEMEKSLLQIEREILNIGIEKIKNPARIAGKVIDDMNSMVELGIRLSTYKELVKREMSKNKAIQSAADLTVNFSRQGEISPFLKSFYGFINPAIQGSSKVIRSVTSKEGGIKVAGTAASLVLIGFLVRMFSNMNDEEGDEKIPEWSKNNKISFSIGNNKQINLWSLPYGYTTFYSMGSNLAEAMLKKKTIEEAFAQTYDTAVNSFSPFGTSLNDFVPTLAKPIYEINNNKGWYGGAIHPPQIHDRTPGPANEQYFENAKTPFIFLASAVNKLTGGKEGRSGIIDHSPNDYQYLFDQLIGGPVEFSVTSLEAMARGVNGEFDPNKTPFVRKILHEGEPRSFSYGIIYDTLEKAGKKDLSEIEKNRFFNAVDDGLENMVFTQDRADGFTRDLLKAQYNILGNIDSPMSINIIRDMPPVERTMLINSYEEKTQKKIREKISGISSSPKPVNRIKKTENVKENKKSFSELMELLK